MIESEKLHRVQGDPMQCDLIQLHQAFHRAVPWQPTLSTVCLKILSMYVSCMVSHDHKVVHTAQLRRIVGISCHAARWLQLLGQLKFSCVDGMGYLFQISLG